MDIAKYVRTLEAEFKELDVERKYWKRLLLSKLPAKIKEHIVEIIEGEHCTYDELKKALLARVGLSKRELEVKLFLELDSDTRSMDRG